MKLKAKQVYEATLVVAKIIREQRPLPQKGKYRLARLHMKLLPEFNVISARRDALITAYDFHEEVGADGAVPAQEFSVPPDKMPEFNSAWGEITAEEIEVDVEPVPLDQLCLDGVDGSIHANELITLGELVRE